MNKTNNDSITMDQLMRHGNASSCWLAIHEIVYDLTKFVDIHPGGSGLILKQAGTDASDQFDKIHSLGVIKQHIPDSMIVGKIDQKSFDEHNVHLRNHELKLGIPLLSSVLSSYDMENAARKSLSKEAWAYYSSGSNDELTLMGNCSIYKQIQLIPRVLINVNDISTETTFFGVKVALPIYITACALGRLGHKEGELCLTRAAGTRNIIQMIPTLASCSLDEMLSAKMKDQTQWYQTYVHPSRDTTLKLIQKAEKGGVRVVCITVDAPVLGKRERDLRMQFVDRGAHVHEAVDHSQGVSRALSAYIDASLTWNDLPWFIKNTSMQIVLKGIQCAEDALIAVKMGVKGIIVSNHGGRQVDTARSSIECLIEVVHALEFNNLRQRAHVFVDGGIRRGSDIFKAIAIGADGVGIGRPFMYGMSAYGQEGVESMIDIFRSEFETTMRLMGTTSIQQIKGKKGFFTIKNTRIADVASKL